MKEKSRELLLNNYTVEIEKQRGVTLIALVITIIVLIILAGVSIATITGDNGIIEQANKAKEQTEIASEKEQIQLATARVIWMNKDENLTLLELQKQLDYDYGEKKTKVFDDGNNLIVQVITSNRYYEVDDNGNVKKIDVIVDNNPGNIKVGINGEILQGTKESFFEIWCIEDLIEWSKNYDTYKDSYIKLCTDLNFKSVVSYYNTESTEYGDINRDGKIQSITEEMKSGIGFTPIKQFNGVFDGQNHKIFNIYEIGTNTNLGLFNRVNSAIIKNVSISGEIITNSKTSGYSSGNNRVAGIAGIASNSTIQNCYNYCSIYDSENENKGQIFIGGIVGNSQESNIINCGNFGNLQLNNPSEYGSVGGIIGVVEQDGSLILNCYNHGAIINNSYGAYNAAAGIIGSSTRYCCKIVNCYNIGDISYKKTGGAIFGSYWYDNWISTLNNCYYSDTSCEKAVNGKSPFEGTTVYSNDYMKSQSFIDELNTYITSNEDDVDTKDCCKWIQGDYGYPTLDFENTWNGTGWSKE